jgi:hypothetical protein
LEQILATHPPKKEVFVTLLEIWKFFMRQRANNWTIEMSQRVDNHTRDIVRI